TPGDLSIDIADAGRVVAGLLWTALGERAIYAYGASWRDPETNKLRANDWLFWQAIQAARAAGHRLFDFGTTPLHHDNLLDFKDRFRPQHSELPYHYFLHTREAPPLIQREGRSAQLVGAILRGLPGPLYRAASAFLMREVG
ncbi:MAG: GNAT family N-acetyltransferase, partial [Anaerolineales bacterium]